MQAASIEVRDVSKSFQTGKKVLKDISLSLRRGEMVALIGASGSGKSTLIRTIGGLVAVDGGKRRGSDGSGGEILILGTPMQRQGRVTEHASGLRSRVGIIFQQFNLVPRLSVLTNVCLGFLGQVPRWRGTFGWFSQTEKKRAMQALARVGIAEQALKRGSQLSGGQQQRAAIARSLVQGSEILIADEPIASLDPSSARRVMDILAELNRVDGITILVSLHQVEYALNYCPRTIALRNGEVVYDGPSSALTPAFLSELYGAESEELFLPRVGEQASDTTPEREDWLAGSQAGYARDLALAGGTA
ncbi:MAG TPA: phosphonate ABC transporter ATP-binding protein [Hyphomicrobiaceae bacterium]|nr:phosphonate ABC transporter ATP-binding protein [Hyphomicrobiaceae bacterium]